MRIAMVGQKRTGSREGGVEVVVSELARRMAARGHEVTCYDRRGAGAPEEPFEWEGVRVVPVTTVDAKGMAALSSSFFATRAALRDKPDVIHYHAEGPCVPLRLARERGVRTVATIHGLDWQRAKWGRLASAYIKLGERTAATCADELVVLSEPARAYFQEAYGREAALVPNGIDPKEPVEAVEIRSRWGLEPGGYLLYLGRIVPEKGLHYLIDAYRGMDTDLRLVVAGGSSDTSEYLEQVRAQAEGDPRVLFTGFVEGRPLEELCSNAYLYVLPSDVEGMPMSLLEAMAYGRCCVTSDIPECADVLAGTGVTFPKGDAAALRAALEALVDDPARVSELGAAARERVRSTYDWERVVDRTLELYEGSAA